MIAGRGRLCARAPRRRKYPVLPRTCRGLVVVMPGQHVPSAAKASSSLQAQAHRVSPASMRCCCSSLSYRSSAGAGIDRPIGSHFRSSHAARWPPHWRSRAGCRRACKNRDRESRRARKPLTRPSAIFRHMRPTGGAPAFPKPGLATPGLRSIAASKAGRLRPWSISSIRSMKTTIGTRAWFAGKKGANMAWPKMQDTRWGWGRNASTDAEAGHCHGAVIVPGSWGPPALVGRGPLSANTTFCIPCGELLLYWPPASSRSS